MGVKDRRLTRALLIGLRTAILSFLAAELFLRFFRPVDFRAPELEVPLTGKEAMLYRRSSVPNLTYELSPNVDEQIIAAAWVRTNSYAMRDEEPLPDDTPGLVRIVVVGDSFGFGLGVAEKEAFPEVLERELNDDRAAGGRYDVLNLSVPGYSTEEDAAALISKGLPWRPQAVIVAYCLNDPEIDPLQPLHVHFHPVQWWQHFNVFRLVALLRIHYEVSRDGGGDYFEYLHAPGRRKWQSVVDAFARIRSATEPRDIPVLVVIFPMMVVPSWEEYRYRGIHEQVARAAEQDGFEVLDLYDAYSVHALPKMRISEDDPHPNALAHRVAAEALMRTPLIQRIASGGAEPG